MLQQYQWHVHVHGAPRSGAVILIELKWMRSVAASLSLSDRATTVTVGHFQTPLTLADSVDALVHFHSVIWIQCCDLVCTDILDLILQTLSAGNELKGRGLYIRSSSDTLGDASGTVCFVRKRDDTEFEFNE